MTDQTFKLYLLNLYKLFFFPFHCSRWLGCTCSVNLVYADLIFKGSVCPDYRTQNNNAQVYLWHFSEQSHVAHCVLKLQSHQLLLDFGWNVSSSGFITAG